MSAMSDLHQEFMDNLTTEDILEWADGIIAALGTEYAARVTEEEQILAHAIMAVKGK